MLPSRSTHTPAEIFIGMCENPKMSLGDKRLHKHAGEKTDSSSSISLHHFCIFDLVCSVTCGFYFFFDLTVYDNSAVLNLANSGKDVWLSSIFNLNHLWVPEVEEQLLIDRMCCNTPAVTAAVWFPHTHTCDFICSLDSVERAECGTQSARLKAFFPPFPLHILQPLHKIALQN